MGKLSACPHCQKKVIRSHKPAWYMGNNLPARTVRVSFRISLTSKVHEKYPPAHTVRKKIQDLILEKSLTI
jgi:hypothetical protein